MATWIKANGEIVEVEPKNGKDFKCEELQKYVGGYFEVLTLTGLRLMVVNEEGKLEGLQVNLKATDIYRFDVIVGDVLICKANEIK